MTADDMSGTTGFQTGQSPEVASDSSQAQPLPQGLDVPNAPIPVPAEPSPAPVSAEPKQVNPLENEAMIREWMTKIADTLVNTTKLAARVSELEAKAERDHAEFEDKLAAIRSDYDRAYAELKQEVADHAETKRVLEKAQNDLATEKVWADTCAKEADDSKAKLEAVKQDKRVSDQAVSEAQAQIVSLQSQLAQAQQQTEQAKLEADATIAHLTEAKTALEGRISNLANAFKALSG